MPVSVRCRTCGASLHVKDSFVGRRINCRECGSPIDVTRSGSSPRRGAQSRSSGGGGKGLLIGGLIAGGILLVAAVGVGAMMVFNRISAARPQADDPVFAPNGQTVDASPNTSPVGTSPSRFDLPTQTGGDSPLSAPEQSGPPNPHAGVGLGDVIGVTNYWKDRRGASHGPEAEFELFSQEPDSIPPDLWNVEVDAPAEPLAFAPERKNVRVKVPIGSQRATTEDIIFPVVPSPFVAVGQNENKADKREVWDITKPEKLGTITDLGVETEMNALSPDGRYFAGKTGRIDAVAGVWDVLEKKPLVNIPIEFRVVSLLAMPQPDLLLVGTGFGGVSDDHFAAYDLPSGEKRYSFSTGWSHWDRKQVTFSPGGRYMLLPYRGDGDWDATIGVFDLNDGTLAGQIRLPIYATWTPWRLDIKGLAVSPEGTELAALLDGSHTSKVIIWSIQTGEIVDHMTFPKKLTEIAFGERSFGDKGTPLVWFPGGKRLLAYETVLLDRELGTNVYQIPGGDVREAFPGLRWPLDEHHLTVLNVDGRDGYVVAYEIPEDKLEQATQRVAESIQKEPEVPVTVVDQRGPSEVRHVGMQWVRRQEASWIMHSDPLPASGGEAHSVALAMNKGTIRQTGLSRTGPPRAVALRSATHDPFGRIPSGNVEPRSLSSWRWHARPSDRADEFSAAGAGAAATWLDVYDLTEGKRVHEYRFTYAGDMLAVSPTATRCVILENTDDNRIDVYDLEDGNNIAGWRPYSSETDELAAMVVSAAMPSENVVVTLSGAGKLIAWQLPEEERGRVQALSGADNASLPAFSPGGRYFSYSDGRAYYFVEIETGTLVGRVADVGDMQAAAYHPDGTRVALLSEHKGGYYLFTVDLTTGETAAPFPVPVISPHMQWHGDRYLLLDKQKLVDVQQKSVAWSYALADGDHLPMSPDDQHWYIADVNDQPVLAATALPDRSASLKLADASLSPEFVLQPGESCSLSLQLNHPAIDASTRQSIESAIRGQLTTNKITVADGQPVTLQVTATETHGESITREYNSFGFGSSGSQSVTFNLKTATFRVAFVSGGQTVWEWSSSTSNDSWFVSHKEGESIAQALEKSYQTSVKSGFSGVELPPYVFAPQSANGLGTTQLTAVSPR